MVGVPICADECTSRQMWVSFARLLVEVDVTMPLPDKVLIEDTNGTIVEQKVIYD